MFTAQREEMNESEWERLDTIQRGEALYWAGAPSHWEGDEFASYEPLPWASLPRDVRQALARLPPNWQHPPGSVH
jgi:hypothetical protein